LYRSSTHSPGSEQSWSTAHVAFDGVREAGGAVVVTETVQGSSAG